MPSRGLYVNHPCPPLFAILTDELSSLGVRWLCLSASSLPEVILHNFPPHSLLKSILCGLQVPFHAELYIAAIATKNRPAGSRWSILNFVDTMYH